MKTTFSDPEKHSSHSSSIRQTLAAIDENILELLNKRAQCGLEAGRMTNAGNAPFYQPGQEELLLETLLDHNHGPLPETHLRAIYREVLSSFRMLQKPLKVGYLGPEGTFSHVAGIEFFGHSMDFWPMPRLDDIFEAVANKDCEAGIVPLENSLHGAVVRSVDLFAAHGVHIQAEWFSRISHSLMSREANLADIHTVYSHAQPLGQCNEWLRANMPHARQVSVDSTAAAAHTVLAEPGAAAIGHGNLAPRLGLSVLARSIEDISDNWTRFVAIGAEPAQNTSANKTSLLFTLPDKPGALAAVLQRLANEGVNMNKLESRPMRPERWKYMFFCDLSQNITDSAHTGLLEDLQSLCHSFRILGAYTAGQYMQASAV